MFMRMLFFFLLFIIMELITVLILCSYYFSNKGFQLSQLHSRMTTGTNLRECSNFVP